MKYCVYITTYLGEKFPCKYIGSSSIDRIENGYRGSVRSKKWKTLWNEELKMNPQMFTTEIVSVHETRDDALKEELKLQIELNVIHSSEWLNESLATVNGFFGRDVNGSLNPMYGKGEAISNWAKANPEKSSERSRKSAITQWSNPETAAKKISSMRGVKRTRKTQTQEEFILMQRAKAEKSAEKTRTEIEYNDKIYFGWGELLENTGITKHLYKKYYLNGIDPTHRIGANGPIAKTL